MGLIDSLKEDLSIELKNAKISTMSNTIDDYDVIHISDGFSMCPYKVFIDSTKDLVVLLAPLDYNPKTLNKIGSMVTDVENPISHTFTITRRGEEKHKGFIVQNKALNGLKINKDRVQEMCANNGLMLPGIKYVYDQPSYTAHIIDESDEKRVYERYLWLCNEQALLATFGISISEEIVREIRDIMNLTEQFGVNDINTLKNNDTNTPGLNIWFMNARKKYDPTFGKNKGDEETLTYYNWLNELYGFYTPTEPKAKTEGPVLQLNIFKQTKGD